jgi:hypothetical protein
MKMPAVRRVMLRLANAEAAITGQESQLAELGELARRLSADEAAQRALLAEVAQHMPPHRRTELEATICRQQVQLDQVNERIQRLIADGAEHRKRLAEIAAHMPPARRAELDATMRAQQAELGTLSGTILEQQAALTALSATVPTQQAEIARLNAAAAEQQSQLGAFAARLEDLSADQAGQRAVLGEVSQHLPPAQRANLETTLHGQQLQLGALNATMHANQIQLGALNDIVQRLSDEARRQRELPVGPAPPPAQLPDKPLPPELPGEAPYTFEQLLNRQIEPFGPDLIFHVHVPKTAGTTVKSLFLQNRFVLLDFDMNTQSFFEVVREDRWLENFSREPPRVPYLLSGHFRLDLPMLRRLRMHHAIVALLRDPISRVLSHYNYTLRMAGNPWHEEILAGTMSFLDYAEWLHRAIGPQYSFFDDTGVGTFARSGTASAEQCLTNLLTKVSLFGLTERFNEYCAIAGYLLGWTKVLAVGCDNVTKTGQGPHTEKTKVSLSDQERDGVSRLFADDIWFYEEARLEYERRTADPRLRAVLAETLPLMAECDEVMGRLVNIRDPGNPERAAFDSPRP